MTNRRHLPRRDFIAFVAAATAAWPVPAPAQAVTTHRVGFLSSSTAAKYAALIDAFRAGLRDYGYVEGKDIVIDFAFADDDNARLPELAAQLVKKNVEVVVTQGTPATRAAIKASPTLPVVMAVAGDAVTAGLVSSIAHPGGNVTGNTFFAPELATKRLDLLKQAVPRVRRIAVIVNPANPVSALVMKKMGNSATFLKLELAQFPVTATDELQPAFAKIGAAGFDAAVVFEDGVTIGNAPLIAELATRQKLPLAGFASIAKAGALIGYGADIPVLFRRAAYFVDRIIKGRKPADLPVERAEKFQFIVNLKAAKTLGLTVPPILLAGADQVVE